MATNRESDPKDISEQAPSHLLSGWRFKAMIATVILSVIGYFLFTLWGGWNDVIYAIQRVGWKGNLVALSLSLTNYFLRFSRWSMFLRTLRYHLPFWSNLRIYMAGFSLTTTPGKAGEALRSVFLHDYGVPYRQSFGAFLSERLSDLLAVVLITLAGLWLYPDVHLVVLGVIAIIILILSAVQNDRWLKWIEKKFTEKFPGRFAHALEFGIETVIAFRSCFKPRVLCYGTILGILAWCAEGLAFYYILGLLGIHISLLMAQFIYAFSLVIGAISILPGGLGGAEVTMLQMLLINGAPLSSAVAATIVIRLTTLWFSVAIGLLCLPKFRSR